MAHTLAGTDGVFANRTLDQTHSRMASPAYQAYQALHIVFAIAPVLAGLDKFFHVLVNWDQYLAPTVARLSPVAPHTLMEVFGVVEIVAGILVAVKPRIGAYVVSAWLLGIVINLLIYPGYFDIALRDFGLSVAAFALGRLSEDFES